MPVTKNNSRRVLKNISEKVDKDLSAMADFTLRQAISYAPEDTGALKRSGRKVKRIRRLTEDIVGVNLQPGYNVVFGNARVFYAKFQEFGTVNIIPKLYLTRALMDTMTKYPQLTFANSVKIYESKFAEDFTGAVLDDLFGTI